jgi:hypothetical protein
VSGAAGPIQLSNVVLADTAPSMPKIDPPSPTEPAQPASKPTTILPRRAGELAPDPGPPHKRAPSVSTWVALAGATVTLVILLVLTLQSKPSPKPPAPVPPVVTSTPKPPPELVVEKTPEPTPKPEEPEKPVAPSAEKARVVISPALDAELFLDGAPMKSASAELKPGKHTVLLKARETGFKFTATKQVKAGDSWIVAPGVGTLTVELVPFGTLKVSGVEMLSGYSTKTVRLWEGRYELVAENKEAQKSFTRPVVVKPDAETKESFNFLPQ